MGRPPIGKVAMSGAERTRRYREKFRHDEPVMKQARPDDALAKELAQAKARIAELEEEIRGLQLHIRFGPKRRAAEPKVEKPPLPPDEERERIIKGLKTRVRNLTWELQATRDLNTQMALHSGKMDFKTMSAIANVLHPDRKPSEAEREHACKLFTSWKADNSKVRRQAR